MLDMLMYEGEPVNRSQMVRKSKACDIRTWEKHLFLDIFSTNIDTFVPSLYQWLETRAALKCLDCRLGHIRTSVSASSSSAKLLPPKW
jgi:hypothetical protein